MRTAATQALVRAASRRAAAPDGLLHTRSQLYYEACRLVLPAHVLPRRPGFTIPALVPRAAFDRAVDREVERAGPLPWLLPPAGPATATARTDPAAPEGVEDDVFDYGLPRLLVCQSLEIADMLRANGLPMESACPVYADCELPLPPQVVACLSPHAVVWVLHDASPEGQALRDRVAARMTLPPGVAVRALGLRPVHAAALHLPVRLGTPPEVAAVPPVRLLRTVHRLVREVRPAPSRVRELRRIPARGFLTWPTR